MHIVSADLIAADLATELDLSFSEASRYLDQLCEDDEDESSFDSDATQGASISF